MPRFRRQAPVQPLALAGGVSPALLRAPDEVRDPVLRVLLERTRSGSRPGRRTDDHVVCLAVEGGGMRGAVTAGMCVVLEAVGLVDAVDRIYGVSAGALNGWALAVGQAALSATHYEDAAERRVIDRRRPLRGGPMIDFDLLFNELIGARKPLAFERLGDRPELRALAISLETASLQVLSGFTDGDEALAAVRASAALPRVGGEPPTFRGERMTDGGLVEPIPFRTPLAEGATHVLVLRSRPAGWRKSAVSQRTERLVLRSRPELLALADARRGAYNREAALLARGLAGPRGAHVSQVAVPDGTRLIGRVEADPARVSDALRSGAAAMAAVALTADVHLCWQPVVYRAASAPA